VDVPVVSGDAIKNSLASGAPPLIASWLGPTKLITAIIFATITNIIAYLPFLTLPGSMGEFLHSLPVVLTCSLVAASSATGISGRQVTALREGDKQIPVVTRLRMEERAQLADVQNLYVYSTQGRQKAPLRQVSSVD